MFRLVASRVGTTVLACSLAALLSGCGRFGFDLASEGSIGAGAVASDPPTDDPTSHAGAGGSVNGGASTGKGGAAGVGGRDPGFGGNASSGNGGNGGNGGTALGGQSGQGSLPPLPCATPFVWWTDFSSDPTALDNNGDSQPDWVIRGGQPFVTAELAAGVWRPAASTPLDNFPPVNFTQRTQARVRMRDTSQAASAGFTPAGFGGAMFWINLDYQAGGDYLAVYGSISTLDGVAHELSLFAQPTGSTQVLAGPNSVATDAFVVLELDLDPASGTVSLWADGTALPTATPGRFVGPNSDQFATIIAPQGTGEFDELWVATCTP